MSNQQQKGLFFAIVAGAALMLLVVVGAKRWISANQVLIEVSNGEWGESVDGISCRIVSIRKQGVDGEYAEYLLTAEVRNLSDEELRVLCFVDQKAADGNPALKVPPLTWLVLQLGNDKRERFGMFIFSESNEVMRLPANSTNLLTAKWRVSKSEIHDMPAGAVLKLKFGGLDPHGQDKVEKSKYWSQSVESGAVKVLSAK
ncbi:MAG: hypothetical protein ACO1QS_08850 [Verrucomicrobiota bacterium]